VRITKSGAIFVRAYREWDNKNTRYPDEFRAGEGGGKSVLVRLAAS